jgi:hypothetical protein
MEMKNKSEMRRRMDPVSKKRRKVKISSEIFLAFVMRFMSPMRGERESRKLKKHSTMAGRVQ